MTEVTCDVSEGKYERQNVERIASDERPPVCRVCERTGDIKDANTFCVECNDHMCGICARAHRGSRMTSRHQLLDKSLMPRKAFKVRHMCNTHPDTLIEYYCRKQHQLLCRHCVTLNHQGCHGDDLVANVCGHVEDSRKFRKVYKGLKDIEHNIWQYKSKCNDNLATIDSNQCRARRDIDNFKKELYQIIDCLVDDIYKEVEGLVDTDKDAMAAISEDCDDMAAEVNDLITEIDINKQSEEKMQLFIVMKSAQEALKKLGNKMESIDANNEISKYSFKPEKQLQDVLESVQKLGYLLVEGETDNQSAPSGQALTQWPKIKPKHTVAYKTGELSAEGVSDSNYCLITGIELIGKDHLAVADFNNDSVKMLSLSQTHQLQLPVKPWDITKIGKDELAVTCPDGGYIQLVSVSRSGCLSLGRQIQVHGMCRGIQYSGTGGGRMVVSFIKPSKTQVIDMSGNVLDDLLSDLTDPPLFSWPHCLALSPDGQCVYISDWNNATVTGITINGRVKFTYRDDQLKRPTGLAVGDDGVIYICGSWSDNIHMVSSEGKKIKILLEEKDGVRNPYGIMYNRTNHKLYVGIEKGVHAFSLIQRKNANRI